MIEIKYHPHTKPTESVKIKSYKCDLFNETSMPYAVIWLKKPCIITDALLNRLYVTRFNNDIKINFYQDRLITIGDRSVVGEEDDIINRLNEGFNPNEYFNLLCKSLELTVLSLSLENRINLN